VVGLYTNPLENAIVLCVDEKTQVQALDRTQPLLPMRPGQIERRTHDYKRNGTVQLIPTYSSWLNLAEVLFNLLQAKALRRGVFTSKQALVTAIMNYLQKFNQEGRTFRWTKTADAIISSNNLT